VQLPTLTDHIRAASCSDAREAARVRFAINDATTLPRRLLSRQGVRGLEHPDPVPTHFMAATTRSSRSRTVLRRYEGRVAITALHGLRGVGKTTLAAAYAERHRGNYRATWWIRAQTETQMRADLVALGVRLGWVARTTRGAGARRRDGTAAARGQGIMLIFGQCARCGCASNPNLPRGGRLRPRHLDAHAWRGVAATGRNRVWPRRWR